MCQKGAATDCWKRRFAERALRFSAECVPDCKGAKFFAVRRGHNSTMSVSRTLLVICAALGLCATRAIARPLAGDHVRVELVSEKNAFVPGQRTWLALRLTHEPHWHTYWINPGDSGLPTKLRWELPPEFKAGDIVWPTPRRLEVGGLYNFGYEGRTLLPVAIDVPADARIGSTVHVALEAKWLVCREECIPGKAMLKLALPVARSAAPYSRWQRTFAAARALQPAAAAWSGSARLDGNRIEVALRGEALPQADQLDAFPVQARVVGYAPPKVSRRADGLSLVFDKSEYFAAIPTAFDLLIVDRKPAASARARTVSVPFTIAGTPAATP